MLVLNFFVDFLKSWNGRDGRDEVFKLLSYCPPTEFSSMYDRASIWDLEDANSSIELYENIIGPLEKLVLDNTAESQLSILKLYTHLIRHWYSLLLAGDKIPDSASPNLSGLVEHVQKLATTLTQTAPSISTYMVILDFFEQYAAIISDSRLREHVRIVVPPQNPLLYTFLFSQSLAVVSRLCAVLCCYKQAIEMAMSIRSPQRAESSARAVHAEVYQPSETSRFNGFIMDICNCILRMKAFSLDEPNAAGCLVSRQRYMAYSNYVEGLDTKISLPALFGVSHSPIMSLQAILAVRDLEDEAVEREGRTLAVRHAGPVTQASLTSLKNSGGLSLPWGDYRVAVLLRLEAQGFTGVSELAKNTMKTLMKPRPGVGGRS